MRRPAVLMIVLCALLVAACDGPGKTTHRDSTRVIVPVGDERYGDCLPADKRDRMAELFEGAAEEPPLPRACGSSPRDRAMIAWDRCNEEYQGDSTEAAIAHAHDCRRKYPPPPAATVATE